MSEEASEPDAAAAAGPPAPKPPMIVVALLGLNLLVGGAGLFLNLTAKPVAAGPAPAAAAHSEPPKVVTGPVLELDPFVVNLDEPGSSRYLKVQVRVEVTNAAAAKLFEKSKTLIRDQLLRYLSGLTVADTQGPENKDKIRDEMVARVAEVIGEDRVRRTIFAEFVVQ